MHSRTSLTRSLRAAAWFVMQMLLVAPATALAQDAKYDEARVRFILADSQLGGVIGYYRQHMHETECREAVRRWDAGVRVTNIDQFRRIIIEGKGWQVVYRGSTRTIDGLDVRLTTDQARSPRRTTDGARPGDHGQALNPSSTPSLSVGGRTNVTNNYYAGLWDASLYPWSDPIHPRTVAVRFEVVDSRTLRPVSNAIVRLRGTFVEERIGALAEDALGLEQLDMSTPARQTREFELAARTDGDGIAVFALSWQKEFPWSLDRPQIPLAGGEGGSWRYARSWFPPVDDIEKVQWIEIRHADYIGRDMPLDFNHLLRFGQEPRNDRQTPDTFEKFEQAWRVEIRKPGVVFCVLRLSEKFPDFGNKTSARPEFFEHIRRRDFGIIYDAPQNLTSLSRREYAGPYFVYLIELALEPARDEIVVMPPASDDSRERRAVDDLRQAEESRAEEQRRRVEAERRAEQERREREAAERRAAEEATRESRQQELQDEARRHPWGIAGETVNEQIRRELGLFPGTVGVLVRYVEPGSAADRAGIRAGMVIESITHRVVSSKAELSNHARQKRSGDELSIGIWKRNGNRWERANRTMSTP